MNKKTNKKIAMFLFLVTLGWMLYFEKSLADGEKGVWMNMLVVEPTDYNNDPVCRSWNYRCTTLKKARISPTINFPRLDDVEGFGLDRMITATTYKFAEVNFNINIYIPQYGNNTPDDYRFYFDTNGVNVTNQISLTGYTTISRRDDGYLYFSDVTPGWKSISIYSYIPGTVANSDPGLILKWGRRIDNQTTWSSDEIIPSENLSWQDHSDLEITIPADNKDKKPIGYYTSGVGVEEYLDGDGKGDGDPKIILKIPEESEGGPSNADFANIYNSNDSAYLFWYAGGNDSSPEITIRNNSISSGDVTLSGTRVESTNGVPQQDVFVKIPKELVEFNETNREMEFEFPEASSENLKQGIGIILPYIDDFSATARPTRLKLKFTAFSLYHGTHSRVIFDLDDDIKNNNLRPLFFFPDGDTRFSEVTPISYRPNYMYRLIGSNEKPSNAALIQNDTRASRIFPYQGESGLDTNDPKTWYPVYGREGNSFDALSSESNYLPNETNAYKSNAPYDAVIESINADEKDWIAFQWYSSNFQSDNVAESPESGGISVIGLLGEEKNRILAICSDEPKTIYKNDTVNLKAWFWENYTRDDNDYCNNPEANGATNVTNSASWSSKDSLIVRSDGNGLFTGVSVGKTDAEVSYTYNGQDLETSTEINVIELDTCIYRLCDESTGYVCKSVTKVGTSSCPPDSPLDIGESCEPDDKWKEVAP